MIGGSPVCLSFQLLDTASEVLSFGPFPVGSFIRKIVGAVGCEAAGNDFVFRLGLGGRRLPRLGVTEYDLLEQIHEPAVGTSFARCSVGVGPLATEIFIGHVCQPGRDVLCMRVLAVGAVLGYFSAEVIPFGSPSH